MENKKYDRLTKSLVDPLIDKYYRSEDLPRVFYKREGLSESRFYTCRQHYLRAHPSLAKKLGIVPKPLRTSSRRARSVVPTTPTSSGFVRVGASKESSVSTASADGYELSYPNGVRLRVSSGIAVSVFAALAKPY